MLCDTMDMSAVTELAHRRLSDFIWRQSKAYKFNIPLLIHFTKCTPEAWPEVWAGLQEKGWLVAGEYVIHKGVIETHNAAQLEYASECNQTAAATAKKTGKPQTTSTVVTDNVTGIVTIVVTTHVMKDVTNGVMKNVTRTQQESKPESKPEPSGTGTISQTSQYTRPARGTKLNFSMLSRIAMEIADNKTGWYYDNHKLKPDMLITAGLVKTLRGFVDRLTDEQAREAWAEAALRTHQASVDGMNITHSLAHYAIGIWRDLMEKQSTPISD